MLNGAIDGLQLLLQPNTLLFLLLGTVTGAFVAIMPGISGTTLMAVLLAFTLTMDPNSAFAMLIAIMAAGGFAGSITAILLNVPGDSENAASCLDGFPLSMQGRAGEAVGASALSSALGTLIGFCIIVLTLPIQRTIVLAFGPPEIFALTILGVSLIAVIAGRDKVRGLISGFAGIATGFIGVSLIVGGERYTFGLEELVRGIPLIPVVIGLFAIPEMIGLLRGGLTIAPTGATMKGGRLTGMLQVLRRPRLVLQSSAIGALVGMIPGVGGVVASWASYTGAQRTSKQPETFGTGNIEGVIAAESAIDTSEASSLIPVFILGIPGSAPTALVVAAFAFHGIRPGASLLGENISLVWVMLFSFLFANLLITSLGILSASTLAKITKVPIAMLAPAIFVFSFVGAFVADGRGMAGVYTAVVMSVLGIAMRRYDYNRAAFIIGFILAPIAEKSLNQSIQVFGEFSTIVLRPIVLAIAALMIVAVVVPVVSDVIKASRSRRDMRAKEGQLPSLPDRVQPAGGATGVQTLDLDPEQEEGSEGKPGWGELVLILMIAGIALLMLVTPTTLPPRGMIFPRAVLPVLLVLCIFKAFTTYQGLRGPISSHWLAWKSEGLESLVRALSWFILLPILMTAVGVIPAAGIYITAFVLFYRGRPTLRRAAIGIAMGVGVAAAFQIGLVELLELRL